MSEDSKLTQSDFRKLLETSGETPRSGSGTKSRKALGGGKHASRSNTGVAARPIPVPPAQRSHRPRPPTYKKSDETSKYRDRAAERRQGIQEVDTDEQSAALLPPKNEYISVLETSEAQPLGMTEEQRIAYEHSKYLGGDIESTHLVKGLDFLLLEKIRAQEKAAAPSHQILDSELEQILDQRQQQQSVEKLGGSIASSQLDPEYSAHLISDDDIASAKTPLGKNVLGALQEIHQSRYKAKIAAIDDSALVTPNQTFLPGRMYYNFGTESITSRVRSQDEISMMISSGHPAVSAVQNDTSDHIVLTKVIAAIRASQSRRNEASAASHQVESGKDVCSNNDNSDNDADEDEADVAGPEPADAYDSDDDIFADAGVDYQVTVGHIEASPSIGPTAMPPSDENHTSSADEDGGDGAVVAPYPESDSEMGVTEPYPESDAEMGVTEPYPESEPEMGVTEPYPESEPEMGVTEPYPESPETRPFKRTHQDDTSENNSDSDADGDAMQLFSEARMRFKEETSDILHSLAPSLSSDSSKRHAKKAKDTGSLDKEWHQTRKLMKEKYGVDIDKDDPVKKG
ncbi:hypothetical protein LPJ53_005505 [Coemansia erecta]|uniref:RED-like N-terminal domain-containing protein n=1 Tax=Coemansia erecta TaxID=147472 RepID=A0A9W7XSC3_9FUNG|nr:hypothetical protein LPJ53_005505 [Coemansia erecta]